MGQSVELKATVEPANAEGSVRFVENDELLGTAPVAGGTALIDVSFNSSGGHGVVAEFISDDDTAFTNSSSNTVAITVEEASADEPSIVLSDIEVMAGESVTVTGKGFETKEAVSLELHSDPVELATVTTNSSGGFSQVVTIPADTTNGKHQIVASGADSGLEASANIQITTTSGGGNDGDGNNTGGSDNDLSFTGAQVGGLIAAAILAVAAGIVLVSVRRRKGGEV